MMRGVHLGEVFISDFPSKRGGGGGERDRFLDDGVYAEKYGILFSCNFLQPDTEVLLKISCMLLCSSKFRGQ